MAGILRLKKTPPPSSDNDSCVIPPLCCRKFTLTSSDARSAALFRVSQSSLARKNADSNLHDVCLSRTSATSSVAYPIFARL